MSADLRRSPSESSLSEPSSPLITATDSTAALILLNDDDHDASSPFEFSSDEDDPPFEQEVQVRRQSAQPLPPSIVLLYLLDPFLKLGAILLPNSSLPLSHGLSSLLFCAGLAAFARHIWYMLARHLRKTDIEDVILDAFARGRGKERQRTILRSTIRSGTAIIRILLASLYLKVSVQVLLPIIPEWSFLPAQPVLTTLLTLLVGPLAFSKSLASKKVVYATWASVFAYFTWLGCVAYTFKHGSLKAHPDLLLGSFWQGYSVTAFAFCSSSTLTLYASLRGSPQPITTAKPPKARSFKILSPISVLLGSLALLPLVIFSAYPSQRSTVCLFCSNSPLLQLTAHNLKLPSSPRDELDPESESRLFQLTVVLNAVVLLLGIPSLLVTIPSLPIPDQLRRPLSPSLRKLISLILVTILASLSGTISSTLNDIILMCTLASTYLAPGGHPPCDDSLFKRPITIVVPQAPSTPLFVSRPMSRSMPASPHSPRASHDELLQRKERALQRKQFRKRIVWDIGVWVLLVASACGFAWGVGRLAGKW
ncbi:hypothetical protein BDN72DRAFT_869027 [Pluteus cervinus]|uniref:Uncharacterized protein n=1 Tax=Pluteus cervinus TaxID=181527 RepID=A0ACD3B6L6_9AGAR|nr:hypothetical protein BDN72DRAFT_869027 [Pluteus cervinus]